MSQPTTPRLEQIPPQAAESQLFGVQLHELSSDAFSVAESVPDDDAAQLESIYRVGGLLAESAESSAPASRSPLQVAQELLETSYAHGNKMGESARELAVRLNQAERTQQGLPPLSFERALDELASEAREITAINDETIRQEGLSMGHFVSSLRRAPSTSVCNDVLRILETRLREYAQAPDKTSLHQEQVGVWRTQRDAIWRRRAELQAQERAALRAASERPARDRAVEQARQRVAESLGSLPEEAATSSSRTQATAAQIELGNRIAQVTNDLRDGMVAGSFAGLQGLSDRQRVVLARELQQIHKRFIGLGADKQQYREALEGLVARYNSGELFS